MDTPTGLARELACVLHRHRVAVEFVQDTRWRRNRSWNIGNGYKLLYAGAPVRRNGVGVVLSDDNWDRLIEVRVLIEGVVTHLISVYAPTKRRQKDEVLKPAWEYASRYTNVA